MPSKSKSKKVITAKKINRTWREIEMTCGTFLITPLKRKNEKPPFNCCWKIEIEPGTSNAEMVWGVALI